MLQASLGSMGWASGPLMHMAVLLLVSNGLFALASDRAAASPSLVAVTPLEGVSFQFGVALSAGGSTVVGSRPRIDNRAYVWTRTDGYRLLDDLGPGAPSSADFQPHDVSGDGSRIVGSIAGQPVVWDRGGATSLLALPVGGTSGGAALGISDDGRHVVGRAHDGGIVQEFVSLPGGGIQVVERPREVPVAWRMDDGAVIALSDSSGSALDVSNDGVVAGNLDLPSFVAVEGERGFRWSQEAGLRFLPSGSSTAGLPWAFSASGISTDGRAIVGLTSGPAPPGSPFGFDQARAYRWGGAVGEGETLPGDGLSLIDLPGFPLDLDMGPKAVSADGSTIVGSYHRDADVAFLPRPFLWTESGGFQDLEVLLNMMGVSTEGWILNGALDVSADGRTIIGTGRIRNEAGRLSDTVWIAVIPEPSTALLLGAGLSILGLRPRGRRAARRRAPDA